MNWDHEKVTNGVLSRSSYINSEAAQIYYQYIDEGDYSSIIIMQDGGSHANLRYTQKAYVAIKMVIVLAVWLAAILDFSMKLHVIYKLKVITVFY